MTPVDDAPGLFGAGAATDPAFANLRTPVHEAASRAKSFAERLWGVFKPYADPNFLTEIRRDFNARFWEMYVTCALLEKASERGYGLSCPKPGPDVLLELNGGRIWIEAVALTNGEPGRPDSLVEPRFPAIVIGDGAGQVERAEQPTETAAAEHGRIPEERIVLRYTNAIREKYRKYLFYLRRGIIDKDDAYVVALNRSHLAYGWASAAIDLPRFLKAVYPIGELEVLIDKKARKIVGSQNRPRFFIPKANKSRVPLEAFVDRRWRGISAVLCSDAAANWWTTPLGCDFEIAYSPLCRRPIPRGIVPAAREWWSVLNDTGGELFCDPERS